MAVYIYSEAFTVALVQMPSFTINWNKYYGRSADMKKTMLQIPGKLLLRVEDNTLICTIA